VALLATVTLPARELSACDEVPIIRAAWEALPANVWFPCDSHHIVVVRDYAAFLRSHQDLASNWELREKGRKAFAFVILPYSWPIYINLDGHQDVPIAYTLGNTWIAAALAGVLAHERVHAMGNSSEAAGLQEEMRLDIAFLLEGRLPPTFNIAKLEEQYRAAVTAERTARHSSPIARK
jgi:hypothetical protein